jgi:hypothetical protein
MGAATQQTASPTKPAAKSSKPRAKTKTALQRAPRQLAPSPDRCKEIQEALISKGYLQGSSTGVWDQNSMDAMRKFQEDQKIEPTGKVNAKSLIGLGLGPKDESITANSSAPANPAK